MDTTNTAPTKATLRVVLDLDCLLHPKGGEADHLLSALNQVMDALAQHRLLLSRETGVERPARIVAARAVDVGLAPSGVVATPLGEKAPKPRRRAGKAA